MTRAGSKLVLENQPRTGPLSVHQMGFRIAATTRAARSDCVTYRRCNGRHAHDKAAETRWSAVQRLVAKTVYVERETALVVGGDNVLLVRDRPNSSKHGKLLPEWGAFPVVRLSIR